MSTQFGQNEKTFNGIIDGRLKAVAKISLYYSMNFWSFTLCLQLN